MILSDKNCSTMLVDIHDNEHFIIHDLYISEIPFIQILLNFLHLNLFSR